MRCNVGIGLSGGRWTPIATSLAGLGTYSLGRPRSLYLLQSLPTGSRKYGGKNSKLPVRRPFSSGTTSRAATPLPWSRHPYIFGGISSRRSCLQTWTLAQLTTRACRWHYGAKAVHMRGNLGRRNISSNAKGESPQRQPTGSVPRAERSPNHKQSPPSASSEASKASATASTSTNILGRFPQLPHQLHRPTKDELLAAATGFWSRLKVRFKWFTIRSVRPFNMDEISGFFSWILVGHVIWILVGTTTFFSLAILFVNTVFAQGTMLN